MIAGQMSWYQINTVMTKIINKAVITGAGGFLGSNLLPQLMSMANEVVAITSKSRDTVASNLDSMRGVLRIVAPQEIDSSSLLMQNADILVNCAFPRTSNGESIAIGLEYISKIYRFAKQTGIKSIVNISSQSVYDPHRTKAASEQDPICLESKYAVAKYASELLLEEVCDDVPHTSIRLASLIGTGFDQRVVNRLAQTACQGDSLTICDNGSLFGYLDVKDAVDALTLVCMFDHSEWRSVYNLGSKRSYTITEIAEEVSRVFKTR